MDKVTLRITLVLLIISITLSMMLGHRIGRITYTPTPALTPTTWTKQNILVEMSAGAGIDIWTDNADADADEIQDIEGVYSTVVMRGGHMVYALVDPRYSKELVAREILDLLSQPIPTTPSIEKSYW